MPTITPDKNDALGLGYSPIDWFDPEAYAAHEDRRWDAKYGVVPLWNEVLALIDKVYNDLPVDVRNETGATILKGSLVYFSGWSAGQSRLLISDADADDPVKAPQFIANADILNNANGTVFGSITVTGLDTSAFTAVGDPVYLSATAGEWTETAPSGADQTVYQIGTVTVKNASTGEIRFYPAEGILEKIGSSFVQNLAITNAHVAESLITGQAAEATPASGDFYLMYKSGVGFKKVDFDNMPGAEELVGSMYMRSNATQTTITVQGLTLPFTAVSDGGGGEITLTMADTTGIAVSDITWLPNTEYAGKYTVQSVIVNTSINVTATFNATASGDVHKGWTKILGTTIEGEISANLSMTASNELTFANSGTKKVYVAANYSAFLSGAPADTHEFCLMIDDDIACESIVERDITTGKLQGMMHGLAAVESGKTVTAYVRNMDSTLRHPTITGMSIVAKK